MVEHWLKMRSYGLVEVLRRSQTRGEQGDTALRQNLTQNTKVYLNRAVGHIPNGVLTN